jgi:hypothetical protein
LESRETKWVKFKHYIWCAVLEVWGKWNTICATFDCCVLYNCGYSNTVCGVRHKEGSINDLGITLFGERQRVSQMNVSPHPISKTKMRVGSSEM